MTGLTQEQKSQIGTLLHERQRALRTEIRQALLRSAHEHHRDIAGMVEDRGDESVADLLVDVQISEVHRDITELRAVEASLARISSDAFGACSDCGMPIEFRRLKAYPTALRCVLCQNRHDHEYAHESTPSL